LSPSLYNLHTGSVFDLIGLLTDDLTGARPVLPPLFTILPTPFRTESEVSSLTSISRFT
jgi:hypothetical protein